MFWIITFFVLAVIVAIIAEVGKSKAEAQVGNALQVISDLTPELIFRGKAGGPGVAIDAKTNRFAIGTSAADIKGTSDQHLRLRRPCGLKAVWGSRRPVSSNFRTVLPA